MRKGHLLETAAISRIVARVRGLQAGSPHRQVAEAAVVVAFFTFATKVAAAGRDIVVAKHFGTADQVDAFLVAWLAPSLAISIAGNSLNAAFMPLYVEARQRGGSGPAQTLLGSTTALAVACIAPMMVVVAGATPVLLPSLASRFDPEKLRLTVRLVWLLLPAMLLSTMTTVWTAALNAHGRFARPAAAALAIPLLAVLALVALGRRWGIYALAVGTAAGYLAEAVYVAGALRKEGLAIRPRWGGMSPEMRRVVAQAGPAASAMVFTAVNPVIDQLMAARLSSGSVASLMYGNKLVAFGIGVGYGSVASAVLPHFSRLAAAREWTGLHRTIRTYSKIVLAVAIPVTLCGVVLSEPIVQLLFQRGAFTRTNTLQVSRIQELYLLQIPFVMTSLLFNKFLVATGGNRILLKVSLVSAVLNVAADYVLMTWIGVAGIALSTSIVYGVTCVLSYGYFRRRLRELREVVPVQGAGVVAGAPPVMAERGPER